MLNLRPVLSRSQGGQPPRSPIQDGGGQPEVKEAAQIHICLEVPCFICLHFIGFYFDSNEIIYLKGQ